MRAQESLSLSLSLSLDGKRGRTDEVIDQKALSRADLYKTPPLAATSLPAPLREESITGTSVRRGLSMGVREITLAKPSLAQMISMARRNLRAANSR